ncbi:hypothetical protein P692DRAFT_20685914, partial [Suillus brevipes Sb2]
TFEQVTTLFSEEVNRQRAQLKMARPGSEYTNAVNASASGPSAKVTNPATSVHIHRQNPKGVSCENPVCVSLPCSLTHDQEHCLQQGGGMEGKVPWVQKGKGKRDVTASANESK